MNVSVIVPIRNEPLRRLAPTLDSIQKAIVADGGDGEIVIVDDGSTGLFAAPASPWVRAYRQEYAGIAAALNHGVRRSQGEWVCWVSAGDTVHPSKLQLQRAWMEVHGHRASFHDHVGEGGREYRAPADWSERLETDNQFCGSTIMVERRAVTDGCWFDEGIRYCVDWDFSCRVQFEGPGWAHLPHVLTMGWAAHEAIGDAEPYTSHTGLAAEGARAHQRQQDRRTVMRRWRSTTRARESTMSE